MKFFFLASYLLLLTSFAFTQTVRKVKITEVEAYINNSDHPLVVNCWATWCAPCVEEIPYFMETVKKYSDQKVELLLISLDFAKSYPTKIQELIKKNHFDATFFWLNETNADYFCPKIDPKWDGTLPSTVFINNKTGYRQFYGRPMTDRQIALEVSKLTGVKK
jgi:thiol-disulfide isomerase/thioredoxin